MSKNKSFFQKLSDSFSSIFPFNSTVREDVSNVSFDRNLLSPITTTTHTNRRLASEAFGRDDPDELKSKRARLHYDIRSLPTSRIIKPITNQLTDRYNYTYYNNNNFNDAASEISDTSNISVSTSGVSSLHPHSSSKRFNLGPIDSDINCKYPRNLNVSQKPNSSSLSPATTSIKLRKEFISSPAKKILEKLDKLTTPITAADKLATILARQRTPINNYHRVNVSNPYNRPPITGKKPIPIKAVTVSATSKSISKSNCGPIRQKQSNRKSNKRIGFIDDVDLDCEENAIDSYDNYPNFKDSHTINLLNIPMLKKSVSTNTDETCFINNEEESFDLEFSFRPPQTINDEEYLDYKQHDKSVSYEFQSKISENEINNNKKLFESNNKNFEKLWKCDICYSPNSIDCLECKNCESISNKNVVIISDKAIPTGFDKSVMLKTLLENETTFSTSGITSNESNKIVSVAGGFLQNSVNNDSKISIFNATNNENVKISSFGFTATSISTSTSSGLTFGQLPSAKTESFALSNQNTISSPTESSNTVSTPFTFSVKKKSDSVVSSISTASSSVALTFGQMSTAVVSSSISSNPMTFGQISTSDTKPAAANVLSTFSFTPSSTGTLPSANLVSNAESKKPFTFGIVSSTGLSLSSSNKLTNAETSKPFSFDKISNFDTKSTPVTSSNGLSLNVNTTAVTSPKPFTFGPLPTTVTASINLPTESKPIAITTTPKTFTFGQMPAVTTAVVSSDPKPFSFDPKPVTDAPKSFSANFGQLSSTTEPKPLAFGQLSSTTDPKPLSFGQISTPSSNSLFSNSKPLFGAAGSDSSSSSGFLFRQPQTTNEAPKSTGFDFQQSTVTTKPSAPSTTSSIFGSSSANEKSTFSFGKTSTSTTSETSSKLDLFGTANSGSSSGFLFGQQQPNQSSIATATTTTISSNPSFAFTSSLQKSESSSSIFGDSSKPASLSSGLFGNNSGTSSNSTITNLFAAPQTGNSKPFMFTPQSGIASSSVAAVGGIATSGFPFNNPANTAVNTSATPAAPVSSTMNFGQSSNPIATPFSLTNNTSQPNMFGAVAASSAQFTFGASSNPSNNMFSATLAGSAQQQPPASAAPTGFNFGSNQPFQFGSSVNAPNAPQPNNNMANCSLPNSGSQRRLLKVRRNRK